MNIRVESADVSTVTETVKPAAAVEETKEKPAASSESEQAENKEAPGATEDETESVTTSHEEGEDGEDETEEKTDDNADEKTEEKPKKKSGFKKRIDKLSKRITEKEREAEYWRQEALKSQKAQEKPAEAAKKEAPISGKPKADDFKTHEEYVEALTDWKIETREKATEAKRQASQQHAELQKKAEAYKKGVEKFSETHDDFDDVIEAVDDVRMPFTLQHLIFDSENGPELSYEIAKNRKEFERICALPLPAMAREIGRIEARLKPSAAQETKEIKTTKAPPPINPVSARGGASKKSPDDMTQREFNEWREKNQRKRA